MEPSFDRSPDPSRDRLVYHHLGDALKGEKISKCYSTIDGFSSHACCFSEEVISNAMRVFTLVQEVKQVWDQCALDEESLELYKTNTKNFSRNDLFHLINTWMVRYDTRSLNDMQVRAEKYTKAFQTVTNQEVEDLEELSQIIHELPTLVDTALVQVNG